MEEDVHEDVAVLGVGDCVEVLHLPERCWYQGKVVEAKPGVRVVEYGQEHEDVTVESIRFGRDSDKRLRPAPPPCLSIRVGNWHKGLWVDAYREAWWEEGVLMDEPGSTHAQIFVPEQQGPELSLDRGEKRMFSLDKVRVSQVWNESTRVWSVKGYEAMSNGENKQVKPQITYQRKRKRIENTELKPEASDDTSSEKPKPTVAASLPVEVLHEQPKSQSVEPPVRTRKVLEKPKRIKLASSASSRSSPAAMRTKREAQEPEKPHIVEVQQVDKFDLAGFSAGLRNGTITCAERLDSKAPIKVELLEEKKPPEPQPAKPEQNFTPVCCINTQAEDALYMVEQSDDVNVKSETGLDDVSNDFLKHPAYRRSALRPSSKKKEKKEYVTQRREDTLREQAIRHLEESGWKKGFRSRQRENRVSMEAYYIAPDGTSYHSLTSACNAWMQQNSDTAVDLPAKEAMRSYQLLYVIRRKYGSLGRASELQEAVTEDGGTRKRRLRHPKRQDGGYDSPSPGAERGKKGRPRLEAILSGRGKLGDGDNQKSVRRTTLFSWLMDMGVVSENAPLMYINKETQLTYRGELTRDGVLCHCCSTLFRTLPEFQVHAGNAVHRSAALVFLEDGRSIMDCQKEALQKWEQSKAAQRASEPVIMDESDECCGLCAEGGELICCDHCPATFHLQCIFLKTLPEGDWFCPKCRCPACGVSQYDGREVQFCIQCERSYHVECVNAGGFWINKSWFCCARCRNIFCGLRGLVGIPNPMDEGYRWTLLRSSEQDEGVQLEHETTAENSSKLALALSVMEECFSPMIDPRRKIDVIAHILRNCSSDLKRLDFRGFYTILLEKEELISVAAIRVHGAHIAEMPIIGTRLQYRRQGMCRRLMDVIEQILRSLEIDTLILPAVPELIDTWTSAFGFQRVNHFQSVRLLELNIVAFPGTKVLHKPLTWLNICRRIPPPLAEKAWTPGSKLHLGVDTHCNMTRKPRPPRHALSVVPTAAADNVKDNRLQQQQQQQHHQQQFVHWQLPQEQQTAETPSERPEANNEEAADEARATLAKTRSNRLVKPSARVAEALASRQDLQPDESIEEEEEQTLMRNELSFLRMGALSQENNNGENNNGLAEQSLSGSSLREETLELSAEEALSEALPSGYGNKEVIDLEGDEDNGEARKCGQCGTAVTPMWRKGPTCWLCNACGLRLRKSLVKL